MMPADEHQPETRQKRAKIVSACSECRRKKTKCNGEQPCRNCQKSSVPCVYPASHTDDKRNGPSKAALEAIEERLKAIEDMLKTIVQSQLSLGELDPVAANKFLNKDTTSKSTGPPSPGSSSYHGTLYISPSPSPSIPPPPKNNNTTTTTTTTAATSAGTTTTGTTTGSNSTTTGPSTPPPSSSINPQQQQQQQPYHSSPSISTSTSSGHELRLPSIHSLSAAPSAEQRDLPPLGSLQEYYYPSSTPDSRYHPQQLDRKRKR